MNIKVSNCANIPFAFDRNNKIHIDNNSNMNVGMKTAIILD